MLDLAISVMTDVYTIAIPIAVVFAIGDIIVCTFFRAAFGGRLWFGGGR